MKEDEQRVRPTELRRRIEPSLELALGSIDVNVPDGSNRVDHAALRDKHLAAELSLHIKRCRSWHRYPPAPLDHRESELQSRIKRLAVDDDR